MHSVTSNAVAESLSYSTTEQKTGGTWIDGKPIYRKVITGTITTTMTEVAHNIANIDTIIKEQCIISYSNAFLIAGFYIDSSYYTSAYATTANVVVTVSYPYLNSPFKFIIEYTKTTD